MRKTFLVLLASTGLMTGLMAQINMPQPSPEGSVYSKVGLTEVTIDYFRPKVKGREIFGDGDKFLQPYGQIWRTGANSGSVLTLSTEAEIAGTKVPAGKYLIFTVPGKDQWSFMLYNDLKIGGNVNSYDKANEVLKTTVKPTLLREKVETLTFNIADISEDNTSANIELAWDNISVKVPLKVNFDEAIMKEIAEKTQVNPANYIAAARYYYDANKDLDQALEWVNLYFENGKHKKQFWNMHLKAQILAKMGKKKEAIKTAEESIATAKASPQGDFGYVKRNQELIASLK